MWPIMRGRARLGLDRSGQSAETNLIAPTPDKMRGLPPMSKTIQMPALSPTMEEGTLAKRSEEHTSELQSLMRISYAVFCLKNKLNTQQQTRHNASLSYI